MYKYIIELGNFLIKMPNSMKINNNSIKNCNTKLWINTILIDKNIILYGYSKSLILNGIILIIFIKFNKCYSKNINSINSINFIKNIKFIRDILMNEFNKIIYIEKFIKFKIKNILNKY